jgi:hypothetical protein
MTSDSECDGDTDSGYSFLSSPGAVLSGPLSRLTSPKHNKRGHMSLSPNRSRARVRTTSTRRVRKAQGTKDMGDTGPPRARQKKAQTTKSGTKANLKSKATPSTGEASGRQLRKASGGKGKVSATMSRKARLQQQQEAVERLHRRRHKATGTQPQKQHAKSRQKATRDKTQLVSHRNTSRVESSRKGSNSRASMAQKNSVRPPVPPPRQRHGLSATDPATSSGRGARTAGGNETMAARKHTTGGGRGAPTTSLLRAQLAKVS